MTANDHHPWCDDDCDDVADNEDGRLRTHVGRSTIYKCHDGKVYLHLEHTTRPNEDGAPVVVALGESGLLPCQARELAAMLVELADVADQHGAGR